MKKLLCMLCLLLALVAVLAACSEEEPPAQEHVHEFGEWETVTYATCVTAGEEVQSCACGEKQTRTVPATGEHVFTAKSLAAAYKKTDATCTTVGEYYYKCEYCDAKSSGNDTFKGVGAGAHQFENGKCTVCKKPVYERAEGSNTIYFGSYPQSQVTDETLATTLTTLAGTLPTAANAQMWTSFGYYADGSVQNYTWFIDVLHGQDQYRGVYFTHYRPYYTVGTSAADYSTQYQNGYRTQTVYWFKYEPIAWTVVDEDTDSAFLVCDMILDAQEYFSNTADRTVGNQTVYANNYQYSSIRAWLNGTFSATALRGLDQQILATTIINDAASTGVVGNPNVCANTEDKVFLLSVQEMLNNDYDISTVKSVTKYAEALGLASFSGTAGWWLRSPDANGTDDVFQVGVSGELTTAPSAYYTYYGVVPALHLIKLPPVTP